MKPEAVHPVQWTNVTIESLSPWMLGCWCGQVCRNSAGTGVVYLPAYRVPIVGYYFAPKSLAAVHETSSSAHADKDVPNTAILRVVTLFLKKKFNATCQNHLNKFISLRKNWEAAGFNTIGRLPIQWLYCKCSLVTELLDLAFWHPDFRTSHRQTIFVGIFQRKNLFV